MRAPVERLAPNQDVTWTANGGRTIGETGGSIIGSVAEAEIMNAQAIAQLIENSGRPTSQHINPHD